MRGQREVLFDKVYCIKFYLKLTNSKILKEIKENLFNIKNHDFFASPDMDLRDGVLERIKIEIPGKHYMYVYMVFSPEECSYTILVYFFLKISIKEVRRLTLEKSGE